MDFDRIRKEALAADGEEDWSEDDDGVAGVAMGVEGASASLSSEVGAATALVFEPPATVRCPPPAEHVLTNFGGQLDRVRITSSGVATAAQSFIRRGSHVTLAMPDGKGPIVARVVHGENDAVCVGFLEARLAQCASDLRGRPSKSKGGAGAGESTTAAATQQPAIDCYGILDLPFDADEDQLKATWKQLLRKNIHPDKGGDREVFMRLRSAYELLLDPLKRKEYDHERGSASEPRALAAKSYFAVDLFAEPSAQQDATVYWAKSFELKQKLKMISEQIERAATETDRAHLANLVASLASMKRNFAQHVQAYECKRALAVNRLAALPGVFRSDDIMRTVVHGDVVVETECPGGRVIEPVLVYNVSQTEWKKPQEAENGSGMLLRSVSDASQKDFAHRSAGKPLRLWLTLEDGEEVVWQPDGADGHPEIVKVGASGVPLHFFMRILLTFNLTRSSPVHVHIYDFLKLCPGRLGAAESAAECEARPLRVC